MPAALERIDPETVVVQPSDVGKTPETVLDDARIAIGGKRGLAEFAPGSVWWARAMSVSTAGK